MQKLPDGNYPNLISNLSIIDISGDQFPSVVKVTNDGHIPVPAIVSVLHYENFLIRPRMFYSDWFDFRYQGM